MNKEKVLEQVQAALTEHRYTHTLGVRDTAVRLAQMYGADVERAAWAAIIHDYAKFRSKEEMADIIKNEGMDTAFVTYGGELLHAPAGAVLAREELGVKDEAILEAVVWHTTGKPGMTVLEKVLFLADYIEPNRRFPGVEDVRAQADEDLDEAVCTALGNTITFLIKKRQPVFEKTLAAYNELILA
ncbi:putative HD superfamily hydrolase involved in NAD metabolism [Salsuginibacillus halophilus]|uniref:bis(5'-nucleosyl)-tetraphosphatase (symmetrical) n=1 Tax=Salsuginibacillus halophilus TaxID=517424 RepID=A0A2P8HFT4_9BACI|nr:bis(5'-nucleosyl)-tetraphosphatase (symmetrical) YqeK [Salsuginibacillus halophilus]PSL45054.1 putative HD superfamily hydrolase involved in NAD metabolism [Salsuginibacillus halophilus]